jgi:hypothetical protein
MYNEEHLENADDISFDSNRQKVNDLIKDNRRFKLKRINYEGKLKNVEVFASGPTDWTIRNAVSGQRYIGHIVGSKSEDLYFKVRFATGEHKDETGYHVTTLFYDDPEQYENHLFQEVQQEIKEKWYKKHIAAKYKNVSK